MITAIKVLPQTLKTLAALALLCLISGCAGNLSQKESAVAAAGFKAITPVKPNQVALLKSLPKGKITCTNYHGKTIYILPDAKNNRAYVGGPTQYQAYVRMRDSKKVGAENPATAQINQMVADQDWTEWAGWLADQALASQFEAYGRVSDAIDLASYLLEPEKE